MKLIKEIYHKSDLPLGGRMVYREAVRAIALQERQVLMIYSAENGDYKFPGGGVDAGETHQQALRRELREESGANLRAIVGEFGAIAEYDTPMEKDFDVFKMISHYYFCQVEPELGDQNLDQYEKDLRFEPVWIDLKVAIEANRAFLSDGRLSPRWTLRDTFVLQKLLLQEFGEVLDGEER